MWDTNWMVSQSVTCTCKMQHISALLLEDGCLILDHRPEHIVWGQAFKDSIVLEYSPPWRSHLQFWQDGLLDPWPIFHLETSPIQRGAPSAASLQKEIRGMSKTFMQLFCHETGLVLQMITILVLSCHACEWSGRGAGSNTWDLLSANLTLRMHVLWAFITWWLQCYTDTDWSLHLSGDDCPVLPVKFVVCQTLLQGYRVLQVHYLEFLKFQSRHLHVSFKALSMSQDISDCCVQCRVSSNIMSDSPGCHISESDADQLIRDPRNLPTMPL